jgi:hypothetical protein
MVLESKGFLQVSRGKVDTRKIVVIAPNLLPTIPRM